MYFMYICNSSRLDIGKYVLANRIVDKWNGFPDSYMECTALNGFKTKIELLFASETQILCNACYDCDSRLYMAKVCVCLYY